MTILQCSRCYKLLKKEENIAEELGEQKREIYSCSYCGAWYGWTIHLARLFLLISTPYELECALAQTL